MRFARLPGCCDSIALLLQNRTCFLYKSWLRLIGIEAFRDGLFHGVAQHSYAYSIFPSIGSKNALVTVLKTDLEAQVLDRLDAVS
jgi:hypothetical protein